MVSNGDCLFTQQTNSADGFQPPLIRDVETTYEIWGHNTGEIEGQPFDSLRSLRTEPLKYKIRNPGLL